jgi:hypothetical protein
MWKEAVEVCMGLIEGERTPDDVKEIQKCSEIEGRAVF